MTPDPRIDLLLEGRLGDSEWEALQADLREDPALREQFIEQKWLHAHLLADRDLLTELDPPARAATAWARSKGWTGWAAAAVVTILGALLALLSPGDDAPAPVATLVEAEGCRWEGSELPTTEGARLAPGVLALAEGMATIRFESGATITLEAPTRLQIDSAMRCRLVEGSLVADVPESAHGFTIDTEKMEVVDLGTKFGVTSSAVGGSHVFVFDGEVKVRKENEKEHRHLLAGKSMHLGLTPDTPDQEISRTTPPIAQEGNWKAFSTTLGRGKDAYIRLGDAHGPTGSHPLLMVKHTDLAASNNRRALVTFDLASLRDKPVEAARLSLKIEASGLGFASVVPDSRFAVYGVHDPAIDRWRENALLWGNAPQPLTADVLGPEYFERLAEFEIRKGSSHGLVDIASEALDEFVQHRDDDLITFLLVRETGEMDPQGLVHAFASREHPTGPAPTLWLKSSTQQ